MTTNQAAELQKLEGERRRLRQDFRQRQRALRAEMQEREDQLNDELHDGLAALDRQRDQLYLSTPAATPSRLQQTSTTFVDPNAHMLEPVVSSSPMGTAPAREAVAATTLEATSARPEGVAGHAVSTCPATTAGNPVITADARLSAIRQSQQAAPVSFEAAALPAAAEPLLHPHESAFVDKAHSESRHSPAAAATELAAAASAATQVAAAPSSPCSTVSPEPEEFVTIDLSHVLPLAVQRHPGMTTYMLSQPRSRATGKLVCKWPSHVWEKAGLPAHPEVVCSQARSPAVKHQQQVCLRTNDETLTNQADLADLAHEDEMTPQLWSHMLSTDPAQIRLPSIRMVQQMLRQNQKALRKRAAERARADSDEDDGDQFGIQAGPVITAAGMETSAPEDGCEEELLPVWGEDESDFADSSSEVDEHGMPSIGHEAMIGSESEDDSTQISLEDAYAMILKQAGLSDEALQGVLQHWMSIIISQLPELATSLGRFPDSQAAQLVVRKRLARIVIMVAGVLAGMQRDWEVKEKPKLQLNSHDIWMNSKHRHQINIWQGDAEHLQHQLIKLVHETTLLHFHKHRPAFKAIRKGCQGIVTTLQNVLEFLFKLQIASLPDAPPKPKRQPRAAVGHRKTGLESDLPEADLEAHSSGADEHEDADSSISGSWLVDDDHDAAQAEQRKDADGGASKPRHRQEPAASPSMLQPGHNPELAQESAPTAQPWDAGHPLMGQTEVLVAPGGKLAVQAPSVSQQTDSQASAHQSPQQDPPGKACSSLQLSLEDNGDLEQSQIASPDTLTEHPGEDGSGPLDLQSPAARTDADNDPEDAPSQGLPAPPDADTGHLKQSGYSLSEDELALVLKAGAENDADAAINLHADLADGKQPALEHEQSSLGIEVNHGTSQELTHQQVEAQQVEDQQPQDQPTPLPQDQLVPMQTDSPRSAKPVATPPSLDVGESPESAGLVSVVSAAQDMDVDIEATDDWPSGSQVEMRQAEGSLWSWQSAKLCAPVTPLTARVKVAFVTKLGSTCKDVSVEQLRPAPSTSTYIDNPRTADRGSVVELDVGHGKFVPAIVLHSSRQVQKAPRPAAASKEHGEALVDIVNALAAGHERGFSGSQADSTACYVYLPAKSATQVVSHSMLRKQSLRHAMVCENRVYGPLDAVAVAKLKEESGFGSTMSSVGRLGKRRDAAAHHFYKCLESSEDADQSLQQSFVKQYLARQPTFKFNRTRKLLLLKTGTEHRKCITIGDEPAAAPGPASGRNKRGCKPLKHISPEAKATARAEQRQEHTEQQKQQRQEHGRQKQAAEAEAQLEKVKQRQQQKEERRKSLQGNVPPPRLALAAAADDAALPLFPDEKSGFKVMITGCMATRLKPHQWDGVRFLWKNIVLEFEMQSQDDEEDDAGGCILAHDMGLGKSPQTIAFLHTFHAHYPDKRSLLVVPVNVVHNWLDEFSAWLPDGSEADSSELTKEKVRECKTPQDVEMWRETAGAVMIISYGKLVSMHKSWQMRKVLGKHADQAAQLSGKAMKARMDADAFDAIQKESDIVVADEGHQIKNPKTARFEAMSSLQTMRRIALTGYPLQNNMDEYYTMIQWCKKDILENAEYFHQMWALPIAEGQRRDASDEQRAHMNKQLSILQAITSSFVHRVGRDQLIQDLPTKHEHVVLFRTSPAQERMYTAYLEMVEQYGREVLRDAAFLYSLCHRPKDAVESLQRFAQGQAIQLENGMQELITEGTAGLTAAQDADGGTDGHAVQTRDSSAEPGQEQEDEQAANQLAAVARTDSGAMSGEEEALRAGDFAGADVAEPAPAIKLSRSFPPDAAKELLKLADELEAGGTPLDQVPTGKLWAVLHILSQCIKRKEKLVIFAQFLPDLDELEFALQKHYGWNKGDQYLRLEGKVSAKKRQRHIQLFQDPASAAQVYLISTRAGSVGINLTAARRMIIYDELWNPVHNAQAIARIFRYSQKRETYIYRLLYKGTAEHRMYRRNVDKEGLFQRVVDRRTIKGMNRQEDTELYIFEPSLPADAGFLNRVAVNSTDEVLKALLRADMAKHSWVASWENHIENLPEDPTQNMTVEQKREAAKRYAEEEHLTRAGAGASNKRRRLVQRFYDDDPDFILTRAQAKEIQQAQAEELQDLEPLPAVATANKPQLDPTALAPASAASAASKAQQQRNQDLTPAGAAVLKRQQLQAPASATVADTVAASKPQSLPDASMPGAIDPRPTDALVTTLNAMLPHPALDSASSGGAMLPSDSLPALALRDGAAPEDGLDAQVSPIKSALALQTSSAPGTDKGQPQVQPQPDRAQAERAAQSKAAQAEKSQSKAAAGASNSRLPVNTSVAAKATTDCAAAAVASDSAAPAKASFSSAQAAMRLLGTSKGKQGDAPQDSSSKDAPTQAASVGMRALESAKARLAQSKDNSSARQQALSPSTAPVKVLGGSKLRQSAHDADGGTGDGKQQGSPPDPMASESAMGALAAEVASAWGIARRQALRRSPPKPALPPEQASSAGAASALPSQLPKAHPPTVNAALACTHSQTGAVAPLKPPAAGQANKPVSGLHTPAQTAAQAEGGAQTHKAAKSGAANAQLSKDSVPAFEGNTDPAPGIGPAQPRGLPLLEHKKKKKHKKRQRAAEQAQAAGEAPAGPEASKPDQSSAQQHQQAQQPGAASVKQVAAQQVTAAQQRQSPSPKKRAKLSPAFPSVPNLFARHVAADTAAAKGGGLAAALAAACEPESGAKSKPAAEASAATARQNRTASAAPANVVAHQSRTVCASTDADRAGGESASSSAGRIASGRPAAPHQAATDASTGPARSHSRFRQESSGPSQPQPKVNQATAAQASQGKSGVAPAKMDKAHDQEPASLDRERQREGSRGPSAAGPGIGDGSNTGSNRGSAQRLAVSAAVNAAAEKPGGTARATAAQESACDSPNSGTTQPNNSAAECIELSSQECVPTDLALPRKGWSAGGRTKQKRKRLSQAEVIDLTD